MLQAFPRPVFLGAGDALFDEVHAIHTIVNIGEDRVQVLYLVAGDAGNDGIVGSSVDIGERFQIAFGMATRCSAGTLVTWSAERCIGVTVIDLVRLAVLANI